MKREWGKGLCWKATNGRKCTVQNYLLRNLASALGLNQQRALHNPVTLCRPQWELHSAAVLQKWIGGLVAQVCATI